MYLTYSDTSLALTLPLFLYQNYSEVEKMDHRKKNLPDNFTILESLFAVTRLHDGFLDVLDSHH